MKRAGVTVTSAEFVSERFASANWPKVMHIFDQTLYLCKFVYLCLLSVSLFIFERFHCLAVMVNKDEYIRLQSWSFQDSSFGFETQFSVFVRVLIVLSLSLGLGLEKVSLESKSVRLRPRLLQLTALTRKYHDYYVLLLTAGQLTMV